MIDPYVVKLKGELQQYQDVMDWINTDPVAKFVLEKLNVRLRSAQAELLNEANLSSEPARLAHSEARACSLLFQTLDEIVHEGRQAGQVLKDMGGEDGIA